MGQSERISFSSGGLNLVGRYRAAGASPGAGVVICHPHPQFGGSMDNNVVNALEDFIVGQGIATLAFNFRGVGGSGGSWDGMRGEVDDVVAALAALAKRPELDAARLGLAGYSFGGLMAMLAAARLEAGGDGFRPRAVALVSPMAAAKPWAKVAELAPFYQGGAAKLVAGGTADQFCPPKSARELLAQLGTAARLVEVEGVDHFWRLREAEAAAPIADFFAAALLTEGG